MGWQTPLFSLKDANAAEQDAYDLLISEWGVPISTTGALQFPPIGQPGIEVSLAGIGIGPRSTVDRCYVTWNLQKILAPSATPNAIRRISVGAPLMFSQPGKAGTIGSSNDPVQAMSQGNLYIFPKTTMSQFAFPDLQDSTETPTSYVRSTPDGGGGQVVEVFGTSADPGVFLAPYLHLVLYLRAPYQAPPTARLPLVSRGSRLHVDGTGGAETCVAQIPTYGRKHIVIQMSADHQCSFRVGALRALAPLGSDGPPRESTEASATAVAKNTDTRFHLDNPNADYVMLYGTPSNNDCQVRFVISAYD